MMDVLERPRVVLEHQPEANHYDTLERDRMAAEQSTHTTPERWLPVPGYEGLYEASDQGHVRSVGTNWRGYGARQITEGFNTDGYLRVRLTKDGKRKSLAVHKIVCETFHGLRVGDQQVCHTNGNPTDNRASNLRWGSAADNAGDRNRHGRTARGERNANAILTRDVVIDIRRRLEEGQAQRYIGSVYGVSQRTVWGIKNGRSWKHV